MDSSSSSSLLSICAAAITILGTLLFLIYKKFRPNPQKCKTTTSSSSRNREHHVFSSFSSVDVPISFLRRLWKELSRKGFDPFTDNEIERCVSIGPELRRAISASRIVIVILSRSYASSSWCLDELVEIMKCKEELGQRLVTLFYELDPIDVMKQTGDFGEIFRKTCKGKTKEDIGKWSQAFAEVRTIDYSAIFWRTSSPKIDDAAMKKSREKCESKTKEDIERWSKALAEVATIDGYHSRNWDDEAAMIEIITNDISNIFNNSTQSSDFEGLVGMEAHMEKMLCLDSDEANMVEEIVGDSSNKLNNSTPSSDFESLVGMGAHMEKMLCLDSDEVNMVEEIVGDSSNKLNNSTPSIDFEGLVGMEAHMEKMLCLDSDEANMVEEIVDDSSNKLNSTQSSDFKGLVGMEAYMEKMLCLESDEANMVEEIVGDSSNKLNNSTPSSDFESLVGMGAHMEKMRQILGLDSDKVRLIGICGLPGSGKTTIAKCIYQQLLPQFELSTIMIDIKGCYGRTCHNENDAKLQLQSQLLSQLLNQKCTGEILQLEVAQDMLKEKKVLVVLDDVDSVGQLDALANESRCFGPGSRIIITTQDHRLLEEQGIQHIYKVDFPPPSGLLHTVYIYCEDTLQYSFASHLSMDFRRKGIYAFVNYSETLDVIERVSAYVVVFSKSCVSFTSRLDKLVRVLQCRRKTGQLVVPVYYGISPSDVVVQEHESADRMREWSSALQELRELPGHHNREECSERELVEEIVKDVHDKLFPTEQIGINSRLLEMEHLLCKQPWGIRRIGIWGMPGIGKTTLAKAVFDQISGGYEASCLIKHFDKAFHEKGLHRLLEEHFGKILKEMPRVCSSITRPSLPRDKLSKKRTLVVLDDLHNPLVFESFLRGIHWFGPGSLIIITSRDKQVFRLCQINHVYEVQSLNEAEALQLFYQCACVKDMGEQNLLKLSMEVVDYASGNPLALRFYGGELKGKKLSEMETTFLKLKLRMPYKIHDLFKSSYETLNDNEKNIFLDIACFFNGENVDYVMQLLEGCSFFPHVGIDVLVEKCLVTISENKVKMHRIIQDFGREIINGETVQIERHRRLWEPWTIKFLLEDDKLKANGDLKATYTRILGTEDIEGIFLDTSNIIFDVKPGAFENMLSLRFLKIYCSNYENHDGLHLPKGLESLPYELRLLHWENYPLQSLPQDFDPCHLVELNLSYSQIQKLWGGTKNLEMLKTVRLCHSQQLTEINDICKAQNIELIDLQGCAKLQIFPAMGQLQHLRVVNLSGCTEIRSFPEVSPNIEELHLQGTGIRELPISTVTLSPHVLLNRELSNLLTEFPGVSDALNHERISSLIKAVSSNQHLRKLFCLNMKDCVHLRSLPHMADLESLKVLNLSGCSELDDIQGFPRNLKELYLAGTAIKEIPLLPWSVELLDAHGCVSLISIPIGLEQLPRYYTFSNCFALSAQVVNFFVKNALTNVERIAREYQQEQKLTKSLAFSFTVPSPARDKFAFNMQSGSSVMIQLGSSWRSTLGFAILVEVAFSEDYHEASGFGVSCVCRWKDKECVSHRLEKNFHCWTPGEGFPEDHMFFFCDLNMHPSSCEGNDPSILADLVVFEFFTVNKQKKLLAESCTVKKCGVYVITVANEDTSSNMTQLFSSSGYLQKIFDNEVEEVLRVIYDGLDENDRNLFLYIACLFNDEEANFLASLVARIGSGISSRLRVLANKSLIHISPCGIIVRHGLLQKIGREIDFRQSTLPGSLIVLDRDFGNVCIDPSSLFYIWKYDIFTSFSEEDDCDNKISHLLVELKCKPISTFKDKMKGSKSVGPELVEAIRESRCLIVVLSKNYASSSRCLDELVEIMNCKKELAQKVVSIFYDVVPSDVRQQIGGFGRAFKNTCIGKSEDEKQKWVRALADVANIAGADSREWDNEANMIENFPHSFKMHSSMCIELKNFVDRIMRIIPDIELAQSAWSSGIQILFLLYKALEKATLLLQYCSESSKLYMAVTGDVILLRGWRVKKSLQQTLTDFRSMVPAVMAIKITHIIQDLRSTVLTIESSEAEAGKAVRELLRRGTFSLDSSDAIRDFHFAALQLQLSTPEAIVIERRSLKSLLEKLDESEVNKRQLLKYLLSLLQTHERVICRDHKKKSFPLNQSVTH